MNPVLVFLIILAAIIVWFLLSFVFYPLGRLLYRIYKDAMDEINKKEKEKEKEEEEKSK